MPQRLKPLPNLEEAFLFQKELRIEKVDQLCYLRIF